MENLLDLINRGCGEGSLDPLRRASEMASHMIESELASLDDLPSEKEANFESETPAEMATFDETEEGDDDSLESVDAVGEEGSGEDEEIDAVAEVEDDALVIRDLMDLVEDNQEISEIV